MDDLLTPSTMNEELITTGSVELRGVDHCDTQSLTASGDGKIKHAATTIEEASKPEDPIAATETSVPDTSPSQPAQSQEVRSHAAKLASTSRKNSPSGGQNPLLGTAAPDEIYGMGNRLCSEIT